MINQKSLKAISLACLAVILASCMSIQPAQKDLPPLRVEYTYWWGDFTMLVAQELGLFEKYGVQVEPIYFEVFSDALPAIATGGVDGALFGLGDTLNTNDSSPLKIVSIYDDGGTNYVVGSPEISTPADLKGKRIGVSLGSIYELFIQETLREAGLTTKDVTLVNMEVEQVPGSLGVTIDAGYVWDPYTSQVVTAGGNILYKSAQQETINPDVIVFRADVIEQRPQDIQAFLKAWFEAVDYRKANPVEANQMIAQAMGIGMEDLSEDSYLFTAEENRTAMTVVLPRGMTKLQEAMTANAQFLIRLGVLGKKPVFDELIEPSYIP